METKYTNENLPNWDFMFENMPYGNPASNWKQDFYSEQKNRATFNLRYVINYWLFPNC
jgi:hypothetical protein